MPFKCEWPGCEKTFKSQRDLADHVRTHTGERPFRCDVEGCGAAFAHKCNLHTHRRTHTGERPFLCKFEGCGAAFADGSVLNRHHKCLHTERGLAWRKRREEEVATFLHEAGLTFNREQRVVFSTEGRANSARIDFVICRDWGQVLLEVDEYQHRHNPVVDECSRMSRILAETLLQGRAEKVHVVRFNPDAYKEGTCRPKAPLADRLQALLRAIQWEPPRQQSNCQRLPVLARAFRREAVDEHVVPDHIQRGLQLDGHVVHHDGVGAIASPRIGALVHAVWLARVEALERVVEAAFHILQRPAALSQLRELS